MNHTSSSLLGSGLASRSRTMGVKLLLVSGLALFMTIPSFFVANIVEERTTRARDVVQDVSASAGGPQTFLGPSLSIPYHLPMSNAGVPASEGVYFVFPARGDAMVKVRTEERHRSLFKVPVYQADLKFEASFDLSGVPSAAPAGAQLDWSRAAIVIGVTDVRGALADGTVTIGENTAMLIPFENTGEQNPKLPLAFFGAWAAGVAQPNAKFNVSANLRFSGAQRLAILAYGKGTHVMAEGDWPSPGFDGSFVPVKRTLSAQGFAAEWWVPFIGRGMPAEGINTNSWLDRKALGISFVEMADPYQSVSRSLKYVLLFVGLLFLSYFVFEATAGKRVHPAQYVLVGIAHTIFYLLLLSMAERIGFDWGFVIAGTATVVLLSANAQWIFGSRRQGLRALAVFGLLYLFIYVLLRLEDDALLLGAVANFIAVAAVMYFTRNIDWYSSISKGDEGALRDAQQQG